MVTTTSQISHQFNLESAPASIGAPAARSAWNQIDEHGLITSLRRLPEETNWTFKRRVMDVFTNCANASYRGLIHGVTRELGLELTQPLEINPKIDPVTGEFLATDPYIKFDGVWVYLYSDYANGLLDYRIDRYISGGNYEHLGRLVDLINSTSFFEARLTVDVDPYTKSMTIVNQSNRIEVVAESISGSMRAKLENEHIVEGSLVLSDSTGVFISEVSDTDDITRPGEYCVDYNKGIIQSYLTPSVGAWARYTYTDYPFLPIASPVVLYDINNNNFKAKMFELFFDNDGTETHGVPTELGVDIINELYTSFPMYWGI
jgi:hypothetical protein